MPGLWIPPAFSEAEKPESSMKRIEDGSSPQGATIATRFCPSGDDIFMVSAKISPLYTSLWITPNYLSTTKKSKTAKNRPPGWEKKLN